MRLRALLGKPAVRVLLLLPVSLVLLYFAFRDVALEGFLAALGEAHLGWIIVAVLVSTASFFVRAARWQQLMNVAEYRVSFFSALYGLLFGYFFNLLIPRAGEVGRCTLVAQRSAISLEMAVGTVVTERVIDLLSTALLTLLAIGVSLDRFGAFLQSHIIAPFIEKQSIGGVIMLFVAFVVIFGAFLLVLWLLRTGRLGEKKRTWWNRTRKGLGEGVRSVLRLRNKGLFLFYTLLLWGCYWLMAYTISFALPATAHLGGGAALAIVVVGTFGMIVPAQGGLGSYHLAVMLWLGVEGVGRTEGLAYATLSHEGQVVLYILLLALCYLIAWGAKHKKVWQK